MDDNVIKLFVDRFMYAFVNHQIWLKIKYTKGNTHTFSLMAF